MDSHNVGDSLSILVVLGSVSEYLPPIAAIFAIVWSSIRIFEWVRYRLLGIKSSEVYK